MYRLDARLKAGGRLLGSTYVTIVDPRAPLKQIGPAGARSPSWRLWRGSARPCFEPPRRRHLHRDHRTRIGAAQLLRARHAEEAASTPIGNGEQARAQVLGGRTPPEAGGLPLNVTDDGERSILELILLGILVASFMALLVALYVSERRGRPLV